MNFPFFVVLFEAGMLTFFKFVPRFCILVSGMYTVLVCTCVLPHYTVIYEDVIFTYVCRLLFYTIYHDKANNNNDMRHETLWVDRTIDSTFIKTDRMVRREAAVAVMVEKCGIKLTFLLLFASFLFSFSSSSFIL